jgi:hypothetical protein
MGMMLKYDPAAAKRRLGALLADTLAGAGPHPAG